MSHKQIDCQGLPCPQPVIQCKNEIENNSPKQFSILVDNEAAKENVSRFLILQGYSVEISQSDDIFTLDAAKNIQESTDCPVCDVMDDTEILHAGKQKNLVFIASDCIGAGDDVLGKKLMNNFLLTLNEMGDDLWRIVMVNGGVRLATEGNDSLETLQLLEKNGVSILVCGTCLEHFKLTSKKAVGDVTNMLDIVTSFQLATKTIRV